MTTNREADRLLCCIQVEDLAEVKRFFEALGATPLREFQADGNLAAWLQVGAGIVELTQVAHGQPFYPPLSVRMVVSDPADWLAGLQAHGAAPGAGVDDLPEGTRGFPAASPAGPPFAIQAPLGGVEDQALDIGIDPDGPNVLHFQTTWWSKRWQEDYDFLSKGLGLVTSRGRSEPEGNRIAFLRAAYEGRAIVEVVDGLFDSYDGPGLHWLISLVVDDAEGFHQRLLKAGEPVGGLGYTNWGALSFTTKCASGPLLFVYQEREAGTPGMVGEPAGLARPE